MPIQIESLRPQQHKIAFAFSSKERMAFSAVTIKPILAEKGFDLYWIDGSKSAEGIGFPAHYKNAGQLCEIHTGVGGGADVAILYALTLLLDKGYDYIGLIENDVKLDAGWFPQIHSMFSRGAAEGLKVGAVSARSYSERIHVPRDGYALMTNVGAGMVLFSREAVLAVLDHYRTGSYGELSFLFNHYTGLPCSIPWQVGLPEDKQIPKWYPAADWFFESSMLTKGLATVAITPTMAVNIDEYVESQHYCEITKADPVFDWDGLCRHMRESTAPDRRDIVGAIVSNYDPVVKTWRALPHQIVKTLPEAFRGGWKYVWSKFNGPFGLLTKGTEASLKLRVHGLSVGMLLDNKGKALTLPIHTSFGNAQLSVAGKEGIQWVYIRLDHSGPYDLEIFFNQPGILLTALSFEGPQPWFRQGYELRYGDLKPFLE